MLPEMSCTTNSFVALLNCPTLFALSGTKYTSPSPPQHPATIADPNGFGDVVHGKGQVLTRGHRRGPGDRAAEEPTSGRLYAPARRWELAASGMAAISEGSGSGPQACVVPLAGRWSYRSFVSASRS